MVFRNLRFLGITLASLLTASLQANMQQHEVEETPWDTTHHEKEGVPTHYLEVPIKSFYDQPENEKIPDLKAKERPVLDHSSPMYIPENELVKDKRRYKRVYLLQIGDQLEIALYGLNDVETKRLVRVDPSGHISYLFIDPVHALGKTIDEVRREILAQIRNFYPHVLISISAVSLIGDQYIVMGEVYKPGTKQVYGEMKVLDALGAAGGFPMRTFRGQLVEYADLDRAFLSRRGDYVPLDFNALIRRGDLSQNIYIRPGDYIYIPSLIHKQVFVLGEVLAPLAYSYLRTASLLEALTWAGGRTERAHEDIVVIRGSLACPSYFCINWHRLRSGCCPDFLLQPGDIVYVPRNNYWWPKEVVKNAIRAFIGAIASTAGDEEFIKLFPEAINTTNGTLFINPGVTVNSGL
jgi:polysaccharide biosynthesis/export protein